MPLVLARHDRLVYKRKALRPHKCAKCHDIIFYAEKYFAVVALNWGQRWAYEKKYHTCCLPPHIVDWMQRTTLKGEDLLARKVTQTLP